MQFLKGFRYIFLLEIIFHIHPCLSQVESFVISGSKAYPGQEDLLDKYLTSGGTPEDKISNIILDAKMDADSGKVLEALKKIQIALLLEKQVPHPGREAFELNAFAAAITSRIDPRYGLVFYRKATRMIPYIQSMDPPAVFILYTDRAGVHAGLMENDSALFYYRLAMKASVHDSRTALISSYNNLGVFYHKMFQYDSAKYYFDLALKNTTPAEAGLYCAILDNLAQLDVLDKNYEPALQTFRYNDSVYLSRGVHNKYLINKVRLLEVMHTLHRDDLEGEINNLRSFVNDHRLDVRLDDVLRFYDFAGKYYFSIRKYDDSKYYHDKYIQWSDSINHAIADQLHTLTQSMLFLQEASFENEVRTRELMIEKTKLRLQSAQRIIFISIASAACILVLVFLYYKKRKQELFTRARLAETELRNKEIEAKLMEKELALKKRDLTNLVLHNTQVHDSTHRMINRLEEIAHHKENMSNEIRSMLSELHSQNLVAERALLLQANIDSVNEEFYQSLKALYPNLTKAEAELCGFLRINLSTKDISILKNVGAPSVKLSKNRLRKKLGISPEEDLYEFIKKI